MLTYLLCSLSTISSKNPNCTVMVQINETRRYYPVTHIYHLGTIGYGDVTL
jgi:hypothetical protein